ncbi:MAG: hypothetical protein UW63_C0078G0007 [Candidatus Uhrbacteria bacterium GW2011_GWF2_44_350]|uniref:Uncharacterized protein n=1 Tax=Candidatus Uhrbacteria bacterium GW2011_GWF2_44_350 TaxID=1619000 RepID=A0A0G1J9R2_9BACT|nr:MAG: hypothetical protein UW63_C0078G0007 [Candidatus Uhrbacteria bacterium GW2011_GWF2_44_350]
METGTCVGCGAEEIEINADGFCTDCAELEAEENQNEETDGLTEEEA